MIGMEVVGLKTFIEKHPQSVELIFPSQKDALIDVNEMKSKILFQEDDGSDVQNAVKEMFLEYIDVINSRAEGKRIGIVTFTVLSRLSAFSIVVDFFFLV